MYITKRSVPKWVSIEHLGFTKIEVFQKGTMAHMTPLSVMIVRINCK